MFSVKYEVIDYSYHKQCFVDKLLRYVWIIYIIIAFGNVSNNNETNN